MTQNNKYSNDKKTGKQDGKTNDKSFTPVSQIKPIAIKDYDPKNLVTKPVEKNPKSGKQMISFPKFKINGKESFLVFQTPWIEMTQGGVPQIGEYYKDDEARSFIKIPLSPYDKEVQVLKKKMEKTDELLKKNTADIVGKKNAKSYSYQPIIRIPKVNDVVTEKDTKKSDKPPQEKFPYMKAKLDIEFGSKKVLTKIYHRSVDKNKKVSRTKVPITTIDDLTDAAPYGSKIRFILYACKMWAQIGADKNGDRDFGMSFKVMQMEVVPSNIVSMKAAFKECAFQDEDSDTKKKVKKDDSDDEEEDTKKDKKKGKKDDDDEGSDDEKKVKKDDSDDDEDDNKKKDKKKKEDGSDDEGSDDENKKDKKKDKKAKKDDSDDEDDDKDKKDKKKNKKDKKKDDSDDDKSDKDEDDDEDKKDKKKDKKKAKKDDDDEDDKSDKDEEDDDDKKKKDKKKAKKDDDDEDDKSDKDEEDDDNDKKKKDKKKAKKDDDSDDESDDDEKDKKKKKGGKTKASDLD